MEDMVTVRDFHNFLHLVKETKAQTALRLLFHILDVLFTLIGNLFLIIGLKHHLFHHVKVEFNDFLGLHIFFIFLHTVARFLFSIKETDQSD